MRADPTTCRRGHPRSPATTYRTTQGYRACTLCRRVVEREAYYARSGRPVPARWRYGSALDEVLAAIARHPGGLRVLDVSARLGYRRTAEAVRSAVYRLRRRGVPVASVGVGRRRRYRLAHPIEEVTP